MADRVIAVGDAAFNSGEFAPIPTGTKLLVSIYDIEEGVTGPNSQKPGSPQFVFTAKVLEDYQWVDPEKGPQNAKGREIRYNYISLDPEAKGAWALVAFAEAIGLKTEKGKGVTLPENLKELQGSEFIAKLGTTSGQDGNIYNRVSGYGKVKSGGGGITEPATKKWSDL